jgi:hypothetical protein
MILLQSTTLFLISLVISHHRSWLQLDFEMWHSNLTRRKCFLTRVCVCVYFWSLRNAFYLLLADLAIILSRKKWMMYANGWIQSWVLMESEAWSVKTREINLNVQQILDKSCCKKACTTCTQFPDMPPKLTQCFISPMLISFHITKCLNWRKRSNS